MIKVLGNFFHIFSEIIVTKCFVRTTKLTLDIWEQETLFEDGTFSEEILTQYKHGIGQCI